MKSSFRKVSKYAAIPIVLAGAWATAQAGPAGAPRIRFENRQSGSGVNFVLQNGRTADEPVIDSIVGGVALLDYDNDGYLDLFFTNGASIPSLKKDSSEFSNRLYHNNRDGTFTDVTARAGVAGEGYSVGVAVGDYDNDGWPDIYVTGVNRNMLYHNNHDGTFTDVTAKAGVSGFGPDGRKPWSVSAAWIDYDNDGLLDLFVANYLNWTPETAKLCGPAGQRLSCSPTLYEGEPNMLFHNNGDGTFTDVSAATGIAQHIGKGMGIAIADYDNDGWMDLFISNDKARNFLFHNLGGKKFEEVGIESSVAFTEDGMPVSSMGADFRDIDNQGWPSIFVTALGGETFPLFRNSGDGSFSVDTYKAGMGFATLRRSGWGDGIYDLDGDGYKDLFVAGGHVSQYYDQDPVHEYAQASAVFANLRNGTFQDVSASAGPDMQAHAVHRGCAFGDLNNDGKVDVVVTAIGSQTELLYNVSPNANHWIEIQTVGVKSNRDGIGTRIKLTSESGLIQFNHVTTAGSFASSNDKRVFFGLGPDKLIREVELRWPTGAVQVLKNVKADQILKVTESTK